MEVIDQLSTPGEIPIMDEPTTCGTLAAAERLGLTRRRIRQLDPVLQPELDARGHRIYRLDVLDAFEADRATMRTRRGL